MTTTAYDESTWNGTTYLHADAERRTMIGWWRQTDVAGLIWAVSGTDWSRRLFSTEERAREWLLEVWKK